MQPLAELLHRIKWDAGFGKGRFALGYYDRVEHAEQIVPFDAVILDPERPGMFSVQDETGFTVRVPLHRVRTVYKNGVVIWQRPRRPE
jgi:uncharacterized protein (UPF0248 family)